MIVKHVVVLFTNMIYPDRDSILYLLNLEYGAYSESNATGSDKYADEEDVIFYYTIDGVEYQCEVGSVRASEQSEDYVGVRYILIVKNELFDTGEFSCKGFDTPGITIVNY